MDIGFGENQTRFRFDSIRFFRVLCQIGGIDAYPGVEMEPIDAVPVIEVVGGVVFTASGDLQSVSGVALQASYVGGGVLGGDGGVFAGSLLPSAPSWVSEYVHVRAPVRETSHASIVHCSCFIRNHLHENGRYRLSTPWNCVMKRPGV